MPPPDPPPAVTLPADPPSLDTEVPVVLLRLDANPFHHGTLGAVRSLGRAGVEVHAVLGPAHGPVARSRYLHRVHGLPALPAGPSAHPPLLEFLRALSDGIGRPAVLIPLDDRGAIAAARLARPLLGRYLLPEQPAGLPERLADKAELASLCRELDLPHPATAIPASAQQAADAARDLGLPLIAKWSRPWLLTPAAGLRSTTLVRSRDAARRLYEHTESAGSALLLQRRLPGGPDTDWFFHGCFTRGGCPVGGTGRKERAWPPRTGLTAVGRWLPNPQVERAALRLAGHLGHRGILDLDFRRDARGRYHLLDFNPRPGAQFRLFTDPATGLDVVRALHLDLTGRPVPPARGAPGRVFRAENAENHALLSALATAVTDRPAARRPGPARTGRHGVERAWFAADDPRPFLAMTGSWPRTGLRKGARRTHTAPPDSAPAPPPRVPAPPLGAAPRP
ncbi:ATP-grasp domain-containing protein [Streptomyces sp. N2A]|uniref:carboxylate--amine ligase n=1 Tax=Streptomyces sp. N2A TaxID=3073936 RepID=UPI0028704C0F|nr:ATP-grasp domain-containing protein [Streptomyces sp. N2A]